MTSLPSLDAMDQRILGALMEKQRTVPASYPLTLNALRTACNQATSREPVTDYSDADLEQRLRELKDRELVRFVWAGKGSRALKFHQRLEEQLGLSDAEVALVTVLLLRGAQSAGELRTRCERLHAFAEKADAEAALAQLAERDLVQRLEKRPGEKERRWVHLLGPVAGAEGAPAATVDREIVLADGAAARDARVRASWDALAEAYAEASADELSTTPFEAWLISRIPELASGFPVADLGCGPGHVTSWLGELGCDVVGYEPAPAMRAEALRWHPELTIEPVGLDMLLRPKTAAAWGVLLAWYSLIHLAPSELPDAFARMARTLRPGGYVVAAFHAGNDVRHADEWLGAAVDLDIVLHDPATLVAAAQASGLTVVEWYVRGASDEEQFDRCYLVARRDA